ncbi:Arc family DNA-binding protein [Rhizobium ruizarguesonis]
MHQISAQEYGLGFFTKLVSNSLMAKQDDYVRYTIRVPREVYAPLEQAADTSGRSMNAEIVRRLTWSLETAGDTLRLDLPTEVWNSLTEDAANRGIGIEDRAIEILGGKVDTPVDVKMLQEQVATLRSQSSQLATIAEQAQAIAGAKESLVRTMAAKHHYESVLMFSQLATFSTFTRYVIEQGPSIPENLLAAAKRHHQAVEKILEDIAEAPSEEDHIGADVSSGELPESRGQRTLRKYRERKLAEKDAEPKKGSAA